MRKRVKFVAVDPSPHHRLLALQPRTNPMHWATTEQRQETISDFGFKGLLDS
jgi:hypothetical protein